MHSLMTLTASGSTASSAPLLSTPLLLLAAAAVLLVVLNVAARRRIQKYGSVLPLRRSRPQEEPEAEPRREPEPAPQPQPAPRPQPQPEPTPRRNTGRQVLPAPVLVLSDLRQPDRILHIPLDRPVILGRSADADLPITFDKSVSRQHCEVRWDGQRAIIQDYGSRNGTFVNDQEVVSPMPLPDGAQLTLGALKLRVYLRAKPQNRR